MALRTFGCRHSIFSGDSGELAGGRPTEPEFYTSRGRSAVEGEVAGKAAAVEPDTGAREVRRRFCMSQSI